MIASIRCIVVIGTLLLLGIASTGCYSTMPANPSFAVTPDEAEQSLADMRAHPHALQRPLVVVGGFMDPNVSPPMFQNCFHRVTGDDRIVTISIAACGSFEDCREHIIDMVQRAYPSDDPLWTTEVDVVGASLGGLASRYAAMPSDDPAHPRRLKIARLFTIGSPHSGASLARLVGFTTYHRDMQPSSNFIKHVAAADAQATYQLYPYVHLHDELVGEQYAAPPGMTPYWLANMPLISAHFSALTDPRILADISRRLRGEAPFTKLPAAALPG